MNDNLTEEDVARTLANPIYALTGMVDYKTCESAFKVTVEKMAKGEEITPETYFRYMLDGLSSVFHYDEKTGCIHCTIELDKNGKKLWSSNK